MEAKKELNEKPNTDKKVPKKKKEIKDKKAEIHNQVITQNHKNRRVNTKLRPVFLPHSQIIKHQGVFKKGQLFAIRKVVQKIKKPEKTPKQNTDAKKDRLEGVLNVLKVG